GGKFFAADRIEHHAVFDLAAVFARYRDTKVRNTTNKIGGAIKRIDDPAVFGAGIASQSALLAEEGVVGIGLFQVVDDFAFCIAVDFGDVVVGMLLVDHQGIGLISGACDQLSGLAGGAQRNSQHWLHGWPT